MPIRKKRTKTNHNKATKIKQNIASYKQIAIKTKGFQKMRWGKSLFPHYRNLSGPKVSKKRIKRASIIVKYILQQEKAKIIKAFEIFAKKKFYNKNPIIDVDIDRAIAMVDNTVLYTEDDCLYGCSDGNQIWISAIKMSNEALVGTILHESLHNISTINGKDICEKDEHLVMKSLGEELDY